MRSLNCFLIAAMIGVLSAAAQAQPVEPAQPDTPSAQEQPQAPQREGARSPQSAPQNKKRLRVMRSGDGFVGVDPDRPYRPIPLNRAKPRQGFFEFYFAKLNPDKTHWGAEIDRRIGILKERAVTSPYFRLCAYQLAMIFFLLGACWVLWERARVTKEKTAEYLTDTLNALRIADQKAIEAIRHYNRDMEAFTRTIEDQNEMIRNGNSDMARQEAERAKSERDALKAQVGDLQGALDRRDTLQKQTEERCRELETQLREKESLANRDLIERLRRAETQLAIADSKRGAS